MDPILRTGLDWFLEKTRSSAHLTELHRALRDLRAKLDRLPSDLFSLESPDEPYALADVLVALGSQALNWQQDTSRAIERKLLAPQVEEILTKALDVRGQLVALSQHSRREALHLPLGEIRRSMHSRGESLPDRILLTSH